MQTRIFEQSQQDQKPMTVQDYKTKIVAELKKSDESLDAVQLTYAAGLTEADERTEQVIQFDDALIQLEDEGAIFFDQGNWNIS